MNRWTRRCTAHRAFKIVFAPTLMVCVQTISYERGVGLHGSQSGVLLKQLSDALAKNRVALAPVADPDTANLMSHARGHERC